MKYGILSGFGSLQDNINTVAQGFVLLLNLSIKLCCETCLVPFVQWKYSNQCLKPSGLFTRDVLKLLEIYLRSLILVWSKIIDNNTTPKMFIGILNILDTKIVCFVRYFSFLFLH